MRLLDIKNYDPIFDPLRGKSVAIVDGFGNVGDDLLYLTTRQMCKEYGICTDTVNPLAEPIYNNYDKILLFAGGNIGMRRCAAIRKKVFESTNIPCWLLPQSAISKEDLKCEKVFFRETVSRDIVGYGEIVPDLALGFDFPENVGDKIYQNGLFLKKTPTVFRHVDASLRYDPTTYCYTPEQYWQLANNYETIQTDRLHFAICGLAMSAKTTLLPVHYHKNKAMFDEWLEKLGCYWSDYII